MDIGYKLCTHADKSRKMQWIRDCDTVKFVPVGVTYPDCCQMQKD